MEIIPLQQKMNFNGQLVTDWKTVELMMGRSRTDCQKKHWYYSQKRDPLLKSGPFSLEEDEIIRETVDLFGGDDKSKDLWIVLGADLNRDKLSVKEHWRNFRNDYDASRKEVFWTKDMVSV